MGIHDRGWYREESGRWGGASEHRGVISLIAITIAVSVAGFVIRQERPVVVDGVPVVEHGKPVTDKFPVLRESLDFHYPQVIPGGQVWRFATSFFLDGSFLFLIFGMFCFYFFGGEMEIIYGTGRFVVFYLMSGVVANGTKLLVGLAGLGLDTHTAGCAGPLFATFVLFALHYPHRPIRIWMLLPVPAWLLVTLYLAIHLFALVATAQDPTGGGLPWVIDPLIGAAVGFAFYRSRGTLFGFLSAIGRRERRRSPADLRVYDNAAPRPSGRSSSPPPPDEP